MSSELSLSRESESYLAMTVLRQEMLVPSSADAPPFSANAVDRGDMALSPLFHVKHVALTDEGRRTHCSTWNISTRRGLHGSPNGCFT